MGLSFLKSVITELRYTRGELVGSGVICYRLRGCDVEWHGLWIELRSYGLLYKRYGVMSVGYWLLRRAMRGLGEQ